MPTYEDVRVRWSLIEELRPRRVAFVVVGTARDRLAHLYQTRSAETSHIATEVFGDLTSAREWLRKSATRAS